jgi:hypothetical protein
MASGKLLPPSLNEGLEPGNSTKKEVWTVAESHEWTLTIASRSPRTSGSPA